MSEYFELCSDDAYSMMTLCGQPLFAGFPGPFDSQGRGITYPTSSSSSPAKSISPENVFPGWENNQLQDMEDIWLKPEKTFSKRYRSTVERDDVTEIQELAKIFVYRAKTSPRHLPYYTCLSPATTPPVTPCPEPDGTQCSATPTHDAIKPLLVTEADNNTDIKDWVNGMTDDLDINSILQEARWGLTQEETLSVMAPTGPLATSQNQEGDHYISSSCEEQESGDSATAFIKQDGNTGMTHLATIENQVCHKDVLPFMQDSPGSTSTSSPRHNGVYLNQHDGLSIPSTKDQEQLTVGRTSVVRRDDVDEIIQVAAFLLYYARNSRRPSHLHYYTCQSPAGTPRQLYAASRLIEPAKLLSNLNRGMQLRGLPWKPLEDCVIDLCGVSDKPKPAAPMPLVADSHNLAKKTSGAKQELHGDGLDPDRGAKQKELHGDDGLDPDRGAKQKELHGEDGLDPDRGAKQKELHEWIGSIWPDSSTPTPDLQELQDWEGQSEPVPPEHSSQKPDDAEVEPLVEDPDLAKKENLSEEQLSSVCLDSNTLGLCLPEMEDGKGKDNGTKSVVDTKKGRKWWKRGGKEKKSEEGSSKTEFRKTWWSRIFKKSQSSQKEKVSKKNPKRKWWKKGKKIVTDDKSTRGSFTDKTEEKLDRVCFICV